MVYFDSSDCLFVYVKHITFSVGTWKVCIVFCKPIPKLLRLTRLQVFEDATKSSFRSYEKLVITGVSGSVYPGGRRIDLSASAHSHRVMEKRNFTLIKINQIPLIHHLITVSPKPLIGLQTNLVCSFLLGGRCPLIQRFRNIQPSSWSWHVRGRLKMSC